MPANVIVPDVGESIVDARVAKWLKKEGDVVNVGDPLVEVETDKIDVEVAAPQGGVLSRIAHGDGADVKVGEVLGVIDEASATARPSPVPAAPAAKAEAATAATSDRPIDGGSDGPSAEPDAARKKATPAARNAAHHNDVDLKTVQGA